MTDFLDPRTPEFRANPYPTLARLRAENPVHWSPVLKGWVMTRYDDVRAVLLDSQLSADTVSPFYKSQSDETRAKIETLMRYLGNWLVFKDPPDHTRLRSLASRAFTTRALSIIRVNVEAILAQLLEDLEGESEVDLVEAFSAKLPGYVIMDTLGVPRDQLADMKQWSDEIKLFIGAAQSSPDKYDRARAGVEAMAAAFRQLIAQQRATPRENVLQMLIDARGR